MEKFCPVEALHMLHTFNKTKPLLKGSKPMKLRKQPHVMMCQMGLHYGLRMLV